MTKAKPLTKDEILTRLVAIKLMVAGMKDLMPRAAGEHRRATCETIEDLIDDVAR